MSSMKGTWFEDRELAETLQQLTLARPWFMLSVIEVLTAEQWEAIRLQSALLRLREQIAGQVKKVLAKYPSLTQKWMDDIVHEVLLRLMQGKHFKRFEASQSLPAPYVVGCAYQYARTVARSYWRGDGGAAHQAL
jgi:hypothetical protein